MHIAQFVSGRGVNGAIVHCRDVCKELVRRGHTVSLVCRPDSWIAQQLSDEPIEVLVSTLKRRPAEIRRVGRWLRQREVDAIHTHMSSAHFFGVLLRFTTRIPCIATAQCRQFQLHWCLNDRVIAASEATAEFHRRVNRVSPRRMTTVRNFADLSKCSHTPPGTRETLRRQFGFADHHVVVGSVGDVNTRKGMKYLVSALPQVLASCPDVRLLVVGQATSPYAQHVRECLAEQLGVADKIVWTERRLDVPELLAAMDIYTLPSLEETLPLSIIEAMAAGLPTVATTVGGIPEAVVDQETGLLVEPKDVEGLASAITRLARDPKLRRAMGTAGYERAYEQFSPDTQMPLVEQVLERTIRRRRAA